MKIETAETTTLRLLDAAANRAREAFRVIEDYLRFVLDARFLTEKCKELRHELTTALEAIPAEARLMARDTQADVGTQLTTATEASRENSAAVLAAGFGRLQEALRSLEEYGKLVDSGVGEQMKQLRYQTYTLQRATTSTRKGAQHLDTAHLYILLNGQATPNQFRQLAEDLVAAGADVLQLRDKHLTDRELLGRARILREVTAHSESLFVMNDRPDLAALSHADGVHVGQDELSTKDVRQIVGTEMLVGISTHSVKQARQAVLNGADYIGVGPVFPSGTKRFAQFPGIALLERVSAEIRLPAFAIGGITCENLQEVLAAGFTRVAVSGAVLKAEDPATVARNLLSMLKARS